VGRVLVLRDDFVRWLATVLTTGYPPQTTPYALGLGALMWTTAFTAAHIVFRYGLVGQAIVLVGALLITNMSATYADLFAYLVLFVLAAMILWLRSVQLSREESWLRRRVNENADVPASILRTGLVFTVGSVCLAWILTSVAVAAPLTEAWRGLDSVWSGVRDRFDTVFGSLTNPDSRIGGPTFGARLTVSGSWVSNDEPVLVMAATRAYYLRTATYDRYTGRGWTRSEGPRRPVGAGELVFPGNSPERPLAQEANRSETVTIVMEQGVDRSLFVPGFPVKVFIPTLVQETAGEPLLGSLDAANALGEDDGYQVTSTFSEATEAQLAGAGTDYPPSVANLYLGAPGVTAETVALARDVAATAEAPDPYHQAKALARYLSSHPSFTYNTDVTVPDDPNQDIVHFFLFDPANGRQGYCEFYASAMVVMARSLGIPARLAVGFAPGERTEEGSTYLYREANAHAWAELYFPGYGWQIFEATKTIDPQFTRASGGVATGPVAVDQALLDRLLEEEQAQTGAIPSPPISYDPAAGAVDPSDPSGQRPVEEARRRNFLLVVGVLTLIGALLFARGRLARRRLRFLPPGDRTWQHLALAAERAGLSRRPAETIYEYAGWLEDEIPSRRPEIRVLADGKVWQAYSGRSMNLSAIERLERAWERLRLPLWWLAFRRRAREMLPSRLPLPRLLRRR
ncbi:MAG TPA: transglutaminaseTgpA domain-containing protein, partial [Candidatus Limnocylindria bacterium]|nr:transglutaminaseTgpA domain-containing protein [Candidatus Limnocylindria bacterium]